MRRFTVVLIALILCGWLATTAAAQDIRIVNNSTKVSDAQIKAAIPAFQQGLDQAFTPAWNTPATLYFGDSAPADSWTITVMDDTGVFGAAGYHAVFQDTPYAVVGADTDISWELVLDHELDEMLVDPFVDRAAGPILCNPFGCTTPFFYLQEVCDPVEYNWWKIDGVYISDFVTPRWYEGRHKTIDYLGLLHHRYGLAHGGYKVRYRDGIWESKTRMHKFKTLRHR